MGNLWSNTNSNDNQENSSSNYYYYPPKNGARYFGSTFIMGNDKFEMTQPESYLFGENSDLNYLGGKPSPFPYAAPFPNEPMQMLKSLINIRKETAKLISPDNGIDDNVSESNYTIEFIFDSDVDCSITVYFLCKEDISTQGIKYIPKDNSYRSETFHYKAGIGQLFSQSSPVFNPQNYNICDLIYNILDDKGEFNVAALYPVVINCVADEGDEPRQSHSLIAIIEKVYDQIYSLKPIKQKIFVDGLTYLLQEIYGIENKAENKNDKLNGEQDEQDKSFECVICMSDLRDTLILPCRHFCACYSCSESLRFQTNNCPICRVPFRALLQIKAVQRISTNDSTSSLAANNHSSGTMINSRQQQQQQSILLSDDILNDVMIDIPPGYEAIPLVEALNGNQSQIGSDRNIFNVPKKNQSSNKSISDDGQNSKVNRIENPNEQMDDEDSSNKDVDKTSLNFNPVNTKGNYSI
ncbi:RING finger protein 157-like protein [Euroglyphus maynei]|uniref:RING-type E3 ubiquitin transferase n=1 Tax=Euroglyphus maynei TaxID=6958 RepID=A0A1Y3AYA4_EURMA|nr:RING finger protein 157-like protein [Euroglyphus maynei]